MDDCHVSSYTVLFFSVFYVTGVEQEVSCVVKYLDRIRRQRLFLFSWPSSAAMPAINVVAQLWKIWLLVLNKSPLPGSVFLCAELLTTAPEQGMGNI